MLRSNFGIESKTKLCLVLKIKREHDFYNLIVNVSEKQKRKLNIILIFIQNCSYPGIFITYIVDNFYQKKNLVIIYNCSS